RWETVARIKENSGDTDRRHPEEARRLHALSYRRFADNLAGIFASVTDNRPSIVGAGLDDIDFVSTHRAVLAGPDFTSVGVNRHSLRIAVSVGINLRLGTRPLDEGIIGRDTPVVVEANNLSVVLAEILRKRFGRRTAITNGCI